MGDSTVMLKKKGLIDTVVVAVRQGAVVKSNQFHELFCLMNPVSTQVPIKRCQRHCGRGRQTMSFQDFTDDRVSIDNMGHGTADVEGISGIVVRIFVNDTLSSTKKQMPVIDGNFLICKFPCPRGAEIFMLKHLVGIV